MLLSLCYVYFSAIGADRLYTFIMNKWKSDYIRYAFITTIAVAPFMFAPTLAWGAAGQLKSSDYPTGWYETKKYLNDKNATANTGSKSTNILVLPWHMYLPISFTGRVVANPTGYFFDQTMITGDNFELEGVPPQNQTPTTKYISNELLPISANQINVGAKLKDRNIQYVLLLKEADWKNYGWLDKQTDLKIVQNNASLRLYKVQIGGNDE
jgi:hypothetical protein